MQPVARGTRVNPGFVLPFVTVDAANDRRILGPKLAGKTVRVGFESDLIAHPGKNFEFINLAVFQRRDKNLPDPAGAAPAHGVHPAVPEIEISDDADALRVRRPHREMDAADAADFADMRAEFFVLQIMGAFAKKIEVVVRKHRGKSVSVNRFQAMAIGKG